ncbi:MAG TPA: Crp/Fnr family transcriptional regulator [Candidatus Binatia bacterium]|nr:Crp/Fnr family transcriptional regulator [Candidatus Binatia bacterium]
MPSSNVTLQSGNRLLAALPVQDYQRIHPALETVSLRNKEVLYEAREPIRFVHFPTGGVVSLTSSRESGATVEIATVGNEGMVGLPVFLGSGVSPVIAICQVPGESLRMPAEVFQDVIRSNDALHGLLHRYTLALLVQIGQGSACNRLHAVEARCARWLLMTHDRVRADQYLLTHEFLAQMLGVRRASVTMAAGHLQQAGLIRYRRGVITVFDRKGLESAACACYRIIKQEYDRLLG